MASAPHILAALGHLRAELRGHGTERQDGRMTLFALAEEARAESLPFICKERPRIYLRQLLAPLSCWSQHWCPSGLRGAIEGRMV